MSPERLAHCLDNCVEDDIRLAIDGVHASLRRGAITPEQAEQKLASLHEDLDFVYGAIGAIRKPYRQVA